MAIKNTHYHAHVSGNYKCRKSVNKDVRFLASLISDYKDTTF